MNQADLNQEYEQFLEKDMGQASEDIRKSYNEMHIAFENYLSAIQEDMWKLGFEYAMRKRGDV